ncbi:hypothetical protein KCP71_13100 [Salmonella enterica subsp. enterica]|nr:hypothetical protein KCP71_13100 [Salmonella enterica subsp. enterica]
MLGLHPMFGPTVEPGEAGGGLVTRASTGSGYQWFLSKSSVGRAVASN